MHYTIGCKVGNMSTVEECLKYFEDKEEVEVDTETTGFDPHKDEIVSLQLGDTENQWFIDCRSTDIQLFKSLLESKKCILHNSKFDYKMLKRYGIIIEHIYDTMLAECVLACGFDKWGYSLKALSKRYLELDLNKAEQISFVAIRPDQDFTIEQVDYGCEDVAHLSQIKAHQSLKLKKFELEYCVNLENEAVKALADIEFNGMYLDKDAWIGVNQMYINKLAEQEKRLDQCVKDEPKLAKFVPKTLNGNLFGEYERPTAINYNSPPQMLELINKGLGFDLESTAERQLSKHAELDEDTSEVIRADHPFLGLLLQNRELAKIVSTYGADFLKNISPVTGRVHTDIWQVLNTGRVSSSNPNLQNLPSKGEKIINKEGKAEMTYPFRNCFKARPGFKWVSIDYSGQELRIMADGSGEQGFIDVLNDKSKDLHCYAGEMMFKRPIDKKKDKALRNKAKKINFGKPYGMGPDKLADMLNIPKSEAEELFRLYAEAFPVLNKWLEDQGKKAIANHFSVTLGPCKRRRWYPEMKQASELRKNVKKGDRTVWKEILTAEGKTHRNGMNAPIQGTGADICKEALVEVRKLIQRYNVQYGQEVAFLVCTVHDAIDCEVLEPLAEDFAKEMADLMIACGTKYVSKVKMEVDITISTEWTK